MGEVIWNMEKKTFGGICANGRRDKPNTEMGVMGKRKPGPIVSYVLPEEKN